MAILNISKVIRIKQLQFDPRYVYTQNGNMYIKDKKDEENIYKILMLSKITFIEKFEQIFLTIYYRHNMMLILEFVDEPACNSYQATLQNLIDYYTKKKLELQV